MKVKELISELQKHNPEKEVMIQQGEESDYVSIYTVQLKELTDFYEEEKIIETVVIEYT